MEVHQRLQRLLGDSNGPRAHLGFGDDGEPGAAEFRQGMIHGRAAMAGCARDLEVDAADRFEARRHRSKQPIQVCEGGVSEQVVEELRLVQPELLSLELETADRNQAVIPQPLVHQAKQEQRLRWPEAAVQGQEHPFAPVRAGAKSFQSRLEGFAPIIGVLLDDLADPVIVDHDRHGSYARSLAVGEIVVSVTAILRQVDRLTGRHLGALEEVMKCARAQRLVRLGFQGSVEQHFASSLARGLPHPIRDFLEAICKVEAARRQDGDPVTGRSLVIHWQESNPRKSDAVHHALARMR